MWLIYPTRKTCPLIMPLHGNVQGSLRRKLAEQFTDFTVADRFYIGDTGAFYLTTSVPLSAVLQCSAEEVLLKQKNRSPR